ncbi:histidine phosphotransferase family protein [Pseudoblastomonas halimionae]|uniref:Histidine phosphotransferase n=1 Tax=Alteriqipengyuania halimionae TaxID=1926630 RepID=A0A6I4U0J7_9SPHN|nr:histidine phosphotransferase family protein [Alteriqipengyuania halimionae]MXP08754.1 histidine phosphotransferase [Alteriqipengyuania halimionae]
MTDYTEIDLASLMCSRLCHDLLSPVGALSNGLELLSGEEDPDMRARCIELLEQSARISTSKLKFFRLAFGSAGGFDSRIPTEEPQTLIAALVADNGRVELNWSVVSDTLTKPAVKCLLNLAHIAIDALVRGGTLDIGIEESDGITEIAIRASGARIAFDENIGRALQGELDAAEISPRTAPAAMLHGLASQHGGEIQYQVQDDALILGAMVREG